MTKHAFVNMETTFSSMQQTRWNDIIHSES